MGFLKSALEALPAAATHPFAFVAYVIVVISWVVVALQRKRNAKLLANLEKLPEADRLNALKAEMGSIHLKEGLSAEQWIRQRQHFYVFMGFLATLIAVVLLLVIAMAQAKGTGDSLSKPGPLIRIHIQISKSQPVIGTLENHLNTFVEDVRRVSGRVVTLQISTNASAQLKTSSAEISWKELGGSVGELLHYIETEFNRANPATPVRIFVGPNGIWAGLVSETCPLNGYEYAQ